MIASLRGSAKLLAPLFLLLLAAAPCDANSVVQRYEMSVLPDAEDWERIGASHAFLQEGGTLVINDNSAGERIAFQTWSGEVESTDEIHFRARVQVVSNIEGHAVTIEIARPGLELILRLYPDHMVLVERDGSGFRWLAGYDADLSEFVELELVKEPSVDGEIEGVQVLLGGVLVMSAVPQATGSLGVGRVIVGSLSYPDVGASFWDWIELERIEATSVRTEQRTLGSIKALFGAP
jgi:hypothetical protein